MANLQNPRLRCHLDRREHLQALREALQALREALQLILFQDLNSYNQELTQGNRFFDPPCHTVPN